jgi:hypothetical protein
METQIVIINLLAAITCTTLGFISGKITGKSKIKSKISDMTVREMLIHKRSNFENIS